MSGLEEPFDYQTDDYSTKLQEETMQPITTFSIVAYDPRREEWGVAVQSKFLAVGAVVPWTQAGAGAVATQSYANLAYGPDGLAMMAEGESAEAALAALLAADEGRESRQIGLVDRKGRAAAFTGEDCHEWAGHIVREGFACQGNILVPGTVAAMAERFETDRSGEGELADWLVAALATGQAAGGDKRGRQSAAVVVVREGGGYGGNNDRYLDLRVDDDPKPIVKLKNLVTMHHLYFGAPKAEDLIPLNKVTAELQAILRGAGYEIAETTVEFDAATRAALRSLIGMENLEERWDDTGDLIDRHVVAYLREKFKPGS